MTRAQHGIGSIDLDRRGFLGLVAAGSVTVMGALAGCGAGGSGSDASSSAAGTSKKALSGQHLTFVGDDAFAPYRYVQKTKSGKKKVVGLDIAVADELARRLGFTYEFEAQEFSATLASVQSSDTSFTMAMSSNAEREKTFDFTRGYYEPRVGVLTLGGKAVTSVDDLKGKSIACTT
ncbi:MAG: transporter substrate-binding domain-containing protein, partial [Olsenella umbonata]|nr:transporter substrate-binding domain-containing protein [Parafannyhessea umbonata]